jgi:mono/diheme cytochrome c family protein
MNSIFSLAVLLTVYPLESFAQYAPFRERARPAADEKQGKDSPQEVFDKRIMPIFRSPNPSSCVQCHLAGVELKNYILPSHEETFQSLRDQGLIDLDQPEKSRILRLIKMGDEDRPGAALIQQKVRRAEYEAFADWIARCAADPRMKALPKLEANKTAQPKRPPEVIRHARKDRLLSAFEDTVWAMRFRCMSCHTEGTAENKKLVEKNGDRIAWIKSAGAEATLEYLRSSKLIDLEKPERSLLLLKPLNDVKHGGGRKFLPGDQGYKAFRAFLEDYARTVGDRYADASSLPKPHSTRSQFGTDIWLKLENTPPDWGDHLLQVDVYPWDDRKGDWEAAPIASSDRGVWGKGKLWQHNLTLLADKASDRAVKWKSMRPTLPAGRYLVKVYVDRGDRLAKDLEAVLGEDDYVGRAEFESKWLEGYGRMTTLDAAKVKK